MRFHDLTDNTGNYLKGANNYPYGKPPKLADDYIPMSWDGDGSDQSPEYPVPLPLREIPPLF